MAALDLPVYPARARCTCTHGLYAHQPRCISTSCSCRRFEAAGGLVPLEIESDSPLEAYSGTPATTALDA